MSNRENKNNLNKIILNKINLKSIIDVINKKNSFIKRQLWALNPEKIGIKYNLTNTTSSKKLKEYNILEKKIGNSLIRETNNKQWTTKLGEQLVADTLKKMGKIVSKPKKIQKYLPDLETPEYIYEVKTRSWTTPGTAGEKVLGTPIKYSEIPKLYGKPLIIICVGYQEYELTHSKYSILGDNISENRRKILDMFESLNITYMKYSDLCK